MIKNEFFNTVSKPWVLKFIGNDINSIFTRYKFNKNILVIRMNADLMMDTHNFYAELISKLKLPSYFGKNLNALNECITDLEWLNANGYLFIIENSQNILINEDDSKLEGFIDTLFYAGEEWSKPIEIGELWDRPALPFHVILQISQEYKDSFDKRTEKKMLYELEM
jgi:hypothetical protein